MALFSTATPPQPLLLLRHRQSPYAPPLASNLALPSSKLAARSFVCSSSSSSSSTSVAEAEGSPLPNPPPPPTADVGAVAPDSDVLPLSGCKGCGREEIESGCNGEGRIQGGIATNPGFGWWPIKAYRPCPGFLASGGRYKRQGQSMDEVVSGGASKAGSSTMKYQSYDDESEPREEEDRKSHGEYSWAEAFFEGPNVDGRGSPAPLAIEVYDGVAGLQWQPPGGFHHQGRRRYSLEF